MYVISLVATRRHVGRHEEIHEENDTSLWLRAVQFTNMPGFEPMFGVRNMVFESKGSLLAVGESAVILLTPPLHPC